MLELNAIVMVRDVGRTISGKGVLRAVVATLLLTAMMELVLIVLSVLVTP